MNNSPNFLGLNVPSTLIARSPLPARDSSRLFVTGNRKHDKFSNLVNYISSRDLVVFNDTKVQSCRILTYKSCSKGKVELLFTESLSDYMGWAIYKSSHKLKVGTVLEGDNSLRLTVIQHKGRSVLVQCEIPLDLLFQSVGHVPLPPYMNRADHQGDKNRYQSLWAKRSGSCAAPTASLHFTDKVLQDLKLKNINIRYCTLHVGLGTFLPVKSDISSHIMHEERFEVSAELLEQISKTKARGGQVIAVGTSVARALESTCLSQFKHQRSTSLFIKPGFRFNIIDKLITNFHQPDSTLILLVQAFAGVKEIRSIYQEAFFKKYRLYSYGDSMLLERKKT